MGRNMSTNPNTLLKADLLDRLNYKCRHYKNGMEHPRCYDRDREGGERIGFFDIETAGALEADWGFLLCYSIKALNGPMITECIKPQEVRNPLMDRKVKKGEYVKDKRLVKQLAEDLMKFDTIVVYYGKDSGMRQRHDIPFSRTRAVKWGLEFPTWRALKIVDMYDIVRGKLKMKQRRMDCACELLGFKNKAKPFVYDVWTDVLWGSQPALDYVVKHNQEDVIALEKLYKRLFSYRPTSSKI